MATPLSDFFIFDASHAAPKSSSSPKPHHLTPKSTSSIFEA